MAQCTIEGTRVTLDQRTISYTNTAVEAHYLYGSLQYWTRVWTPSGTSYWSTAASALPTFDAGEQISGSAQPALLTGEYRQNKWVAVKAVNIGNPRTVRLVLKGGLAELTANGDQTTKQTLDVSSTAYNTATKQLTITMPLLSAVDSWQLNSTSAVPAQNEVEMLAYAGVAYSKGILLSPYTIPSDSTTGVAHTVQSLAESGYLTQSETSFHCGTLLKDFRKIAVGHDSLPPGVSLGMTAWVDGAVHSLTPTYGESSTVFALNQQGYSIKTQLSIVREAGYTGTPKIKSVNVLWDFVKTRKHQYLLDCRTGAGGGRWDEDSEEAIAFLFSTADEQATFEDRFIGSYEGTVEEVQFAQANYSAKEGYGGLVRVTVRESR